MPEHAQKPASKQTTQTVTTPPTQTPKPKDDEKVSKALDAFARASDPKAVQAAASAYIKRTDKVEDKQLVGTEERGIKANGTHESAAQATLYGRAEVVELADAYAVLVQAGLIVGASLKLTGELEAKYGKLTTKLGGNLTLFAGVVAQVTGRAQVGADGVVLQGSASAFAGAKGKGSVELTFDVGALGLGGEIEAEGKAGAWAEAEGELAFSKESIAVQGSVKAFAGVEGEVTGTGTARLYGRDAFTVKAGLTGQLGAGGEVGGGFKIKGGKIELHLDAKGSLGFGGGGDIDMTADLKPVAVWAWRQADKAKWALRTDGKGKDILDHPAQIVDPLSSKIAKYSQAKIDALHLKKAENFVKIEKLQAYVGEVMPRKQIKGRPNAAAIDACIKQAIEKGLRTTTKVADIEVTVTDGKIMKLDKLPEPDDLADRFAVKSQKTGQALTSIVST
ncbi:MAG: hypothetical protein JO257_35270 [Deltaproteobacteria bacterium]|nr:hypothetical protein [Deltaproteobacteria bacterium]